MNPSSIGLRNVYDNRAGNDANERSEPARVFGLRFIELLRGLDPECPANADCSCNGPRAKPRMSHRADGRAFQRVHGGKGSAVAYSKQASAFEPTRKMKLRDSSTTLCEPIR